MSGILVHEWLESTGGAENVFDELTRTFPDAERFCLWDDSRGRFAGVAESVLARTPLRRSKALALPVMPAVWRRLPDRDADWVLCSSHAFAHHARFGGRAAGAPKLVYVHTPARYVWAPNLDQRGAGVASRAMSAMLKPIDRRRAAEPVALAANSRYIADRIARTWGREARVIHPPVPVGDFALEPTTLTGPEARELEALPGTFVLGVSRFVTYKRLDAVIDAGEAAGLPVVLAGSGPREGALRERAEAASVPVTFLHQPSPEMIRALYRRASVLVLASVEDFGIVPVEAMAAGTPVIVNAVGGAAESVIDGVTGVHVHSWTRSELGSAVERALAADPLACVARAWEFDTSVFVENIRSWVGEHAPVREMV